MALATVSEAKIQITFLILRRGVYAGESGDIGDAGDVGHAGGDIDGDAGGDDEKRLLVKPFSTTAVLNGSANRNATFVAMTHDT